MSLKRYQERVVREFDFYLTALQEAQASGHSLPSMVAWKKAAAGCPFAPQETGDERDLPWVALKVPTGGGKTLLATQIIAAAYRRLLQAQNGAGLVLWVVPSDQIFKDTIERLRDPGHLYRRSLEAALSRRIEVWDRESISRLTPTQLGDNLNILVLKLQGTNRQDKESLKFFRDTGGQITRHFPVEDDFAAHAALRDQTPNLELFEFLGQKGEVQLKTSLANLVRLCRPVVIVDEGHKAASKLARDTLKGFNPSLVVEMSATYPTSAPVLSSVSGQELLDEEMIKLPIMVATETGGTWANCLSKAYDRRAQLEAQAREIYAQTRRFIRPIILVQVERTGKDQRGPGHIHALDVFEHLTQRLGVPADKVKIKSSERDDIEGINLMADDCPVEWIITKQALQEGWDCPFAYILVSLNNTQSITAMTQLVGRILRQPFQTRTECDELNQCYVYCLHRSPFDIVKGIRAALSNEGYEGDRTSVVDENEAAATRPIKETWMKHELKSEYGEPEPKRILLPRFCLETRSGEWRLYDYFAHSLPLVRVGEFNWQEVRGWDLRPALEDAKAVFHRVVLHDEALEPWNIHVLEGESIEDDARARAWLASHLGIEWLGIKTLRRVVDAACAHLLETHGDELRGRLSLARFALVERLRNFIERQCDEQTETEFRGWLEQGRLRFLLEPVDFTFAVPERRVLKRPVLRRNDGTSLQRSLFDEIEDDGNELERDVALSLDSNPAVRWWYRNLPEPGRGFWIQGPHRARIYPDYIVRRTDSGKLLPCVLFFESKGDHLTGNIDTKYKKRVATYFSDIGKMVDWQRVTWLDSSDLDSAELQKHAFVFEVIEQANGNWHESVRKTIGEV